MTSYDALDVSQHEFRVIAGFLRRHNRNQIWRFWDI